MEKVEGLSTSARLLRRIRRAREEKHHSLVVKTSTEYLTGFVNFSMTFNIEFKPSFHRGAEQIGIYFLKNKEIEQAVKKTKGIKWSQTNRCWYIALNKENCENAMSILKNYANINAALLYEYFLKKRQIDATLIATNDRKIRKPVTATNLWKLSRENLQALEKFIEQLKLKAYNNSTIRTYRNEFL